MSSVSTVLVASYLGAGMRAWAAMRKRSMMKEQTMLELNISSLIWENWDIQKKRSHKVFWHFTYFHVHKHLSFISHSYTAALSVASTRHTLNLPLNIHTLSSMCVSLNTRVSGVMCSLCMRSLLRTSMACLMRLLISLEVDCHMLGSEPFVKEAKIYEERI